jgi:hypothetical protein
MNYAERKAARRRDPAVRAQVGEAAQEAAKRALHSGGELEEQLIDAEHLARQSREEGGVPVHYQDGAGKVHLEGPRLVQTASGHQIDSFSALPSRTCGTCRFFDLKKGQEEMVRQRFAERLVLEENWSLKHLGAPLDHAGLCGASGGTLATTTVSDAGSCEGYRPRGRLFRHT